MGRGFARHELPARCGCAGPANRFPRQRPGQLRFHADWYNLGLSRYVAMPERVDPVPSSNSPVIASRVDATSARFEANMRFIADLVSQLRNQEEKIREGGGPKAIENQHAKGRRTAHERIQLLVDENSFFELGKFAAHGMYEEWGGAPAAGVITGLARIHGRLVMIIANDATVKAGAFFPMTAKKVIRAQNIAIENHVPTIYLVDSAGVFLPLQEDVFPDTDDFGRVFRNNAVMSAMGIQQIAAIMGMCVAGGGSPAGDVRSRADDRRQRIVSGRTGAGAGGDRTKSFGGGTGRGGDAFGNQRHRGLS